MIHQREKKKTVLASRDGWWEKTGGVREKKKLTCKAKEWYLAY